jgi:hypothetical protein
MKMRGYNVQCLGQDLGFGYIHIATHKKTGTCKIFCEYEGYSLFLTSFKTEVKAIDYLENFRENWGGFNAYNGIVIRYYPRAQYNQTLAYIKEQEEKFHQ